MKNKGETKNREESFVKGVVCPVKIRGTVWSVTLSKLLPLFFTGRKLHPPGIGTEATAPTAVFDSKVQAHHSWTFDHEYKFHRPCS